MANAAKEVKAPTQCPSCADPNCTATMNELREFADWNDLADHTDEEVIVGWVNKYARKETRSKEYHKSYQERNKSLLRFAKEQLDPDELEALKRQADAKAAERSEG